MAKILVVGNLLFVLYVYTQLELLKVPLLFFLTIRSEFKLKTYQGII